MAEFFNAVIPAKAGIQVLNGIARLARDSQRLIAGGSAPAPWVTFFARAKKVTKESTPPERATTSSVPRPTGRSTNSPGANYAPRARTRSRLKAPGGAAVLGARYGSLKKQVTIYASLAVFFLIAFPSFSFAGESVKENCVGINAFRCRESNEAELIKKYPHLAKRNGISLILNIQNEQPLQFKDCKETYCDIYHYWFREYFRELGYFLIEKKTIEETTYSLIHQKTGKEFEIDEIPLFSPNARRFITVSVCDAYCTDRLQIWKVNKSNIELECTFKPVEYWAANQAIWRSNDMIEIIKEIKAKSDDVEYTKVSFHLKLTPHGWGIADKKISLLSPDFCAFNK